MGFEDGDYRATELLGAGGSAQVWAGVKVSTGRPVAIKVFAPDRLAAAVREAALASAVDHSHLVSVIDVIGSPDRALLVTELAVGGDLADLLDRRGQLTAGETLTVLLPMAAALATAHERQIVHGDLSARNIVFDRAGRPLLADLGAARAAAELSLPVATTPVDAAPELARGGAPTPASDMFSLGSLGLACLTGRHAWPAEDLRDVLIQAAAGQWPDPPDAAGPPELIAVIRGLLEHDPERRPGAAAVVVDLRAAGRPEPIDLQAARPARAGASEHGDELAGENAVNSIRQGPTGGGRHVRRVTADSAARSGRGAASAQLATALTRVRPDAVPRAVPPPAGRSWRWRLFFRSRRAERSTDPLRGPSFTPMIRIAAIIAACLVVGLVAGLAGLLWARWDRDDPVALGPAGATTSVALSAPASPPPVQAPGQSSAIAAGPNSRPAPASSFPAVTGGGPGSPSAPPRVPTTAPQTTGMPSPASNINWTMTIRSLDDARSRALMARDARLLDSVYSSDSAARAADARVISMLLTDRVRVSGAKHAIRKAKMLGGSPIRVAVDDSLPSYAVLDENDRVVGHTESRSVSTRVLILVPTAGGYRISTVQST